MPEPHFSTLNDDLPRTLRRARDERDAREREVNGQRAPSSLRAAMSEAAAPDRGLRASPPEGVTVTRISIPFRNLVAFFMKAVFAALPALIVLMIVLWTIGEVLQRYFPWLLKMRILIQFPG
ncbi:MAG: hypothetical protein ACK4TL_05750 [Hyphomicrobiaceae bacterium]